MSQILAAYIDGVSTLKDKTVKIVLKTQELTGDELAKLFLMSGNLVKCLLSDNNISKEIIVEVDNLQLDDTEKKSPSQRQRDVLYRLWERNPGQFETFTLYYNDRMERIINQLKDRLD